MTDHYFTSEPKSKHQRIILRAQFFGREFIFETDAGVFSRTEIDAGTNLLIDSLEIEPGDKVLDIGCGYGPLGIAAGFLAQPHGSVDMIDINLRAVELARENAIRNGINNIKVWQSDGFSAVSVNDYDWIITNPPIRAGKKVIYPLVTKTYDHLKLGGRLALVIRTKQGAKSMEKHMAQVFGNVETIRMKSGYRILQSAKGKENN